MPLSPETLEACHRLARDLATDFKPAEAELVWAMLREIETPNQISPRTVAEMNAGLIKAGEELMLKKARKRRDRGQGRSERSSK